MSGLKQFLLQPNDPFPNQELLARLFAHGIRLVIATPCPRERGFRFEEREPQQDEQGVWRQVWKKIPLPPPTVDLDAEVAPPLDITQSVSE